MWYQGYVSTLYPQKKTLALFEVWESSESESRTKSNDRWGMPSLERVPKTIFCSPTFKYKTTDSLGFSFFASPSATWEMCMYESTGSIGSTVTVCPTLTSTPKFQTNTKHYNKKKKNHYKETKFQSDIKRIVQNWNTRTHNHVLTTFIYVIILQNWNNRVTNVIEV